MINFKNLIPRVSLKGADISNMPPGKDLSWFNLAGAICEYSQIGNSSWLQEGLILYTGMSLKEALIAEQVADRELSGAWLSNKYRGVITVSRSYSYTVTIQRKSRKKVKETRPSLAGVDISESYPRINLSQFDLNGAICEMKKLGNPSWVQNGLIIHTGDRVGADAAMEEAIEYFEKSWLSTIAKPKYKPGNGSTCKIVIELLEKTTGDGKR